MYSKDVDFSWDNEHDDFMNKYTKPPECVDIIHRT